ncbi:histidine kinase/DNA gyrase B/HSP90-like ATPase [Thermosediminibacter litoriperuensis]|uniref:histidine kinase n=2 Tax=Thermosediminibacter litoriperuensis TaxID=291989 RepID=A0A5S5AWM8_9FIRM|nr:histidine kinase/DNA gyrase B/HSP90-like ATPase [Thermosediminibacter litoriperuensis]
MQVLRGLRKRLLFYYLVITLLMGITSLYSYYSARTIISGFSAIFADYLYLNDLYSDVSSLETNVEKYLATRSSEAILEYYNLSSRLQEKSAKLAGERGYDKNSLMLKDIGNMIQSLLDEADAAVNAKRGRISSQYLAHFTESHKVAGYIKQYINELLYNKLQEGSQKYDVIRGNMNVISFINIFIILGSMGLNVFLAVYFTYKMTGPIIELSSSAERISSGDFDVDPVLIETDDEVRVLAEAFNKMAVSIKNYIDKIKGQAEMEKRLQEQEMQNLMMKNLLKDARLKFLQSQINPHFLFNTLNAASQLALMEGAEKTAVFIEKVANLFRYNLKRLDRPVTLRDEIEHVRTYLYILKTRFGDKVQFTLDIDESLLELEVPSTIVQPLVENAFIHGIEGLERNGRIDIKVKKQSDYIAVVIEDDGQGMEESAIRSILNSEVTEDRIERHVSGIGLHNVINRMMLFYNVNRVSDVIEIYSRKNSGTRVILKIPLAKGGKNA